MATPIPYWKFGEFRDKLVELIAVMQNSKNLGQFLKFYEDEEIAFQNLFRKSLDFELTAKEKNLLISLPNLILYRACSFILVDSVESTIDFFKKFDERHIKSVCPEYYRVFLKEASRLDVMRTSFKVLSLAERDIDVFRANVINLARQRESLLLNEIALNELESRAKEKANKDKRSKSAALMAGIVITLVTSAVMAVFNKPIEENTAPFFDSELDILQQTEIDTLSDIASDSTHKKRTQRASKE